MLVSGRQYLTTLMASAASSLISCLNSFATNQNVTYNCYVLLSTEQVGRFQLIFFDNFKYRAPAYIWKTSAGRRLLVLRISIKFIYITMKFPISISARSHLHRHAQRAEDIIFIRT